MAEPHPEAEGGASEPGREGFAFGEWDPSGVEEEPILGVDGAVAVHNVLTTEESSRWLAHSETLGYDNKTHPEYQNAHIDKLEMRTRRNDRCVTRVSPGTEEALWRRIAPYAPQHIDADEHGVWHRWGLNDMWRFYRYSNGDEYFPVHKDNTTVKSRRFVSWLTVLIYLSDDFDGGHTSFFNRLGEEAVASFKPRAGSVLLFHHTGAKSAWHCGGACTNLNTPKYVLRTDVMYETPTLPEARLPLSAPYNESDDEGEEVEYVLPRASLFSE